MTASRALICLKATVGAEPRENLVTWERLTELIEDAVQAAEDWEYSDRMGDDM